MNQLWDDIVRAGVVGVPVLQAAPRTASYYVDMEDSSLAADLASALALPGYGSSAEEILYTCKLALQADKELDARLKKAILDENQISEQTWKRLVSIGRNQFLEGDKDVLPASISTLYRISLLRCVDYLGAIGDGVINTKTTTREIEAYAKRQRIESAYYLSKEKIYMFSTSELSEANMQEMLAEINAIAEDYGAFFDSDDLEEIRKKDKKFKFNRDLSEINGEIRMILEGLRLAEELVHAYWPDDDDELTEYIIEEMLKSSIKEFTKTLMSLSKSRISMMEEMGGLYCRKIVQQYILTESRTQRYNYKRRLGDVARKYPSLADDLDYLMKRFVD